MMQTTLALAAALALAAVTAHARSLQLKDLPAPVQKTVQDTLKGGEIKNISKEVEKGVTQYEVETVRNGKHRDFNVDATGKLVVVEEEVDLTAIPAAARAAITTKSAGGKVVRVETVDKGDGVILYEAACTTRAGKKGSILVKANGTEAEDR